MPRGFTLTNSRPALSALYASMLRNLAPASIMYLFRQHSAGQSFDIQIFYGDKTVAIDKRTRDFVVKVAALILDMRVLTLEYLYSLAATIRLLALAARKTALCNTQIALCLFKESWIVNLRSIIERGERRQTHINTYRFRGRRQRCRIALDGEDRKPAASFVLNGDCLDRTVNGTMELDFDLACTLDVQRRSTKFAAVAVSWESKTVPSAAWLEPWKSRSFTAFDSGKECAERLVQSPENILASGVIGYANQSLRSHLLQLFGLIVVIDRLTTSFPCTNTFFESAIIQVARFAELGCQRINLRFCGVHPVFESLSHGPLHHCRERKEKSVRKSHS